MPATIATTTSTSADLDRLLPCEDGPSDSTWAGWGYPTYRDAQRECLAHWLWADDNNDRDDVLGDIDRGFDAIRSEMKAALWTWPAKTTYRQARRAWDSIVADVDAGAACQSDHDFDSDR